ncbi:organic cation transporter protein-like [Oculina patagonica]
MAESAKAEDEQKTFEFDDIFEHVSSFGKYQIFWLVFTGFVLVFPVTTQFTLLVFANGTPDFQCVTPNVTCDVKKCCDPCKAYEFKGPFHSTVSEWNLICDRAYLGATLQSVYFAGMLVGSFVTGMISDAWGRKKCIFVSNAVMVIAGIASAFVHSIPLFAVLRFILGFSLTGVMLSQYIYVMELVGPSKRTAAGNLEFLFHNGFQPTFVLIAYFLREWRWLILTTIVPAVLLFPFWKIFPESPRWLIAHDRLEEAQSIIESYGGKDKDKPVNSEALKVLLENVRRDQLAREQEAKKYTPIDMFRTPKLRKFALIFCYQWFAVALVSFGIFLFVNQLVGNIYVNYLIMEGVAVFKLPATWYLFLKFGRRACHSITMFLVGITFILVLILYKDHPMATTALSVCGYLFIDCTWISVYLITSELFPTVLRNTAQGTGSTTARVGGILAPYVALMGQLPGLSIAFPVAIFTVVGTLAGILMYWIPETVFSPMYQTIEEAEAAEDDYGLPCCGKRPRQEVGEETDAVQMRDLTKEKE